MTITAMIKTQDGSGSVEHTLSAEIKESFFQYENPEEERRLHIQSTAAVLFTALNETLKK